MAKKETYTTLRADEKVQQSSTTIVYSQRPSEQPQGLVADDVIYICLTRSMICYSVPANICVLVVSLALELNLNCVRLSVKPTSGSRGNSWNQPIWGSKLRVNIAVYSSLTLEVVPNILVYTQL